MKNKFAFILGNGTSRLQLDCRSLLKHGYVYGCNRIYQDLSPDILVSTDKNIAHEIQESGYSLKNIHYTRKQNIIKNSGAKELPDDIQGMSSGPACLGLACKSNQNYIFMIGMDLKGINNKINNMYAGTKFYKSKDELATPYSNWQEHILFLMQKNINKNFFHVNPLDNFTPDKWKQLTNFETMSLESFKQMINNL